MAEYFKIGKLVAVHGLKGELVLKHELGKKTSLKGLQAIFIEEKKDSFIPWFIQSANIKSDTEIYLKLEGIDFREAPARITQKEVWLGETDFKKFAAKTAPINLLGYTIINKVEPLGEILECPSGAGSGPRHPTNDVAAAYVALARAPLVNADTRASRVAQSPAALSYCLEPQSQAVARKH